MKQSVSRLFYGALCLLFLLACQRLVEKPETPESAAETMPPLCALMMKAPADMPTDCISVQTTQQSVIHRSLPVQSKVIRIGAQRPACDGNGTPLTARSYVRTVYTACRLSETAG